MFSNFIYLIFIVSLVIGLDNLQLEAVINPSCNTLIIPCSSSKLQIGKAYATLYKIDVPLRLESVIKVLINNIGLAKLLFCIKILQSRDSSLSNVYKCYVATCYRFHTRGFKLKILDKHIIKL